MHLTRFYSNSINSTRPIQDDRPAQYYMSSNIEFLDDDYDNSKLCPTTKSEISDMVSVNVNIGMKCYYCQ